MRREEADAALVALGAAYDRISAAMFALDGHPGLTLLRDGGLRGDTHRVAVRTLSRTEALWSQFAALGGGLEQARTVRAARTRPGDDELRALTVLLGGPVIALDADGLVASGPAIGAATGRLTLPALARDLERQIDEVTAEVGAVRTAYDRVTARFAALTGTVNKARVGTEAIHDGAWLRTEVERLAARLTDALGDALADPVAAAGAGPVGAALDGALRDLATDVAAVGNRVAELRGLAAAFPDRLAALSTVVDAVAAGEAAAGQAYGLALEKIANPNLPPLPAAAAGLRAHLAQLHQLRREDRWLRLADELAALERAAGEARARAAALTDAADGLLRRRTELRGRLDAYRAKAGRLGLAEHGELTTRYGLAHGQLYVRPCDLSAATRAVVAYQRCLDDLIERPSYGRRE